METAEGTVVIEPDLEFIRDLSREGGETFKKCFQCGTCAATCPISPEVHPFPRKEMAWAAWGMRDRLLKDPDVWLCHRCNDCSVRCPRGARPGDVLAAVRREGVLHYATPRFLARWMSQPRYIPLLLGFPAVLLGFALFFKGRLEDALGIAGPSGNPIVFPYSPMLPHWLLDSIFGLFGLFALVAAASSVFRFWRALKAGNTDPPVKGVPASAVSVIKRVVLHEKFLTCTTPHSRPLSHLCVFFGFLALTVVTLWVITSPINPLIRSEFAYPFGFLSPWKVLANLGGAAVFVGCLMMIWDRLYDADNAGASRFFDWALVWTLLAVVATGFVTEFLHFLRMVPHRHVVYFVHLVCVFALLIYLPYSKFAHVLYRVTAMVYAEHVGREVESGGEATAPTSGTSP